jgi:DNA-binding response OmpR family regulator
MAGRKILVIDDDKTMVTLITALLRKEGHQVIPAFDANSGFMIAQRERPDLVLLDMEMPAGGGMATWKRLQMSTHTSGIPVVFVSATSTPGFAGEVEALGAAGFIQKPFDPEIFGRRVELFFKRATGQTEAIQE